MFLYLNCLTTQSFHLTLIIWNTRIETLVIQSNKRRGRTRFCINTCLVCVGDPPVCVSPSEAERDYSFMRKVLLARRTLFPGSVEAEGSYDNHCYSGRSLWRRNWVLQSVSLYLLRECREWHNQELGPYQNEWILWMSTGVIRGDLSCMEQHEC